MAFLYFKALHIIFIVTWFAGLFYIVRLFIYQTEALEKPEPERSILQKELALMAKRLWVIITWPSAVITLIMGWIMLYFYHYNIPTWLWVKLSFVFLLYAYHGYCHYVYKCLQRGEKALSSAQLRLLNEVATLILFAVVFLVVLKSTLNSFVGLVAFIGLAILLMTGIKFYKFLRRKNKWEK